MSWLFSQALVEEYSAGICLDGEPSAQLNVMPTLHKFWHNGKTTEPCDLSQYGLTLKLLMVGPGTELLTLYLAAFHAKTLAQREKAPGSMASVADSGCTWPVLLAKFDPSTSSWKTAQLSLLGGSESFSGIWPQWGSMQGGVCLAQESPDFLIEGTESGLSLPTPSGVNGGRNHTMGRVDEWGGSSNPLRGTVIGSLCLPEFEELVMGWPVMWTALMPYETAKFRQWLQLHGKSFPVTESA